MPHKAVLILALMVLLTMTSTITVAQEESGPEVVLTGAEINIDISDTNTVTAEYQFQVGSIGAGDAELTEIEGTMWHPPDRTVSDLNAAVNGEEVEATISEESAHDVVSVPLEEVNDGDTVTVTLEYQIDGPTGDLYAPLWVPEYSTAGEVAVIHTTITLPEGQHAQGDSFPEPERIDGNLVEYDTLHVPGYITLTYDDSPPGFVGLNTLYSVLGVAIIIGLVVGGLYIDRKTAQS